MAIHGFRFEGLEEFRNDLQKVVNKYPDQTEKEVFSLAGKWTKDVNEKLSQRLKSHRENQKALEKSWKRSREFGGGELAAVEVRNTAPHWHLVENGHAVLGNPRMAAAVLSGKLDPGKRKGKKKHSKKGGGEGVVPLGRATGLHCAKETAEEWNNGVFADHVEAFVDRMLREENL